MPIHRDLEELQEQLSDLKNSLVLKVFGMIRKDQFEMFRQWSDAFMEDREEDAIRLLGQLLSGSKH